MDCEQYLQLRPCRAAGCVWSTKVKRCMSKEEHKELQKEQRQLYYQQKRQDPEFRERQRLYDQHRYRQNPEARERKKLNARQRRQDPEVREQDRLYSNQRRQDPEVRERDRLRSQHPEVRERQRLYQRQYRLQNPELRERERLRHQQRQQDPEFKEQRRLYYQQRRHKKRLAEILEESGTQDLNQALEVQAIEGNTHNVRILLKEGATNLHNALIQAIRHERVYLIKTLAEMVDLNQTLEMASYFGDMYVIERLMKLGATDVNAALVQALVTNNEPLVRHFTVVWGGDLNWANNYLRRLTHPEEEKVELEEKETVGFLDDEIPSPTSPVRQSSPVRDSSIIIPITLRPNMRLDTSTLATVPVRSPSRHSSSDEESE